MGGRERERKGRGGGGRGRCRGLRSTVLFSKQHACAITLLCGVYRHISSFTLPPPPPSPPPFPTFPLHSLTPPHTLTRPLLFPIFALFASRSFRPLVSPQFR